MAFDDKLRDGMRELSIRLDGDVPLSIAIHNESATVWAVHVSSSRTETPIVKSGDDLGLVVLEAIDAWQRRHAINLIGGEHRAVERKGKR